MWDGAQMALIPFHRALHWRIVYLSSLILHHSSCSLGRNILGAVVIIGHR
jgi:hypothetical protein